ncbi:MAG TPA: hypothetical protein VF370_03990 [Candidatus Cryosericum sp.]
MKQFGRSLRAAWHGTIWQWWFLLAGFSRIVAEGVRFVVSTVLMYTLGDAYAGMDLFTPELTLWYLGTAGNDPLRWFNARALQVVTAYALGWLLVGLLPAWRKQRPRHALVMLETACVFVAANLTALVLWIFVFKYDSHTITSTNWVLMVFQSFTLPAYCIVGVVVAMAGARATWRTAGRALVVGLSLFFINLACERSSEWVLARLFSNMDFTPLWAGLLQPALTIGVFTVAALFVYAAVADSENLWAALRKGFSFVVHHAWVALVTGTVLLISNPSVIYVIQKILWWLGGSYASGFDGNSKFSLMDVHTFLVLVALAVASQYYADAKKPRVAEQVTSAKSVPARGNGLLAVKWQLAMATPLLVLALATVSLAPALSSSRTNDGLFGAATTTMITLAGSSAHWNAKYVVLVRTLLKNGETRSSANLDVSWTGPSSETITQVRYKLSDPGELKPGTLSAESGGLGAESGRWVLHNEGVIVGRYSGPGATQELLLTITWKGQTETIPLKVTQDQTVPANP